MIEKLPPDVCLKILCLLDQQQLATAHLVCRKWRSLASENTLWFNLFIIRWGKDSAAFHAPEESKSWKDVYAVQDRCDRVGLGLKIIREGVDYYLVHQGEIQQHLGRRPEGKKSIIYLISAINFLPVMNLVQVLWTKSFSLWVTWKLPLCMLKEVEFFNSHAFSSPTLFYSWSNTVSVSVNRIVEKVRMWHQW